MAHRESAPKRPTTPLQRISRNSLRSHSLSLSASRRSRPSSPTSYAPTSHSHSHPAPTDTDTTPTDPCPSLSHLTPLFQDLSDAFADLHSNLENLESIQLGLDGFNEAFGGWVYGLRMNAYTTDFPDAPGIGSFRREEARRAREAAVPHMLRRDEGTRGKWDDPTSPTVQSSAHGPSGGGGGGGNDTTFMTNRDDGSCTSDRSPKSETSRLPTPKPPTPSSTTTTGGKPGGSKRGGATAKPTAATRAAQQKALLKWCATILPSLPIKYREQQPHRHEMELVLGCLKKKREGLYVPDIVGMEPTVAAHRARECCNVLVVAKVAAKINKSGLLYRLDERYLTTKS